jgi:4-hydroxyphenylpyruvate dioxygenase
MQPAIATVCLSGVLNEKLEAIAAAGFTGVELFENDLLAFSGTARDVRRMADDLGLKIITYQPFRDFEGLPPEKRARALQRAERKLDTMAELGCDLLMVCSNVSPESLGGIERAAADLHELGERAARRGCRVGFEALAWGRHINDYRDAWEAVRRAAHAAVGVVLDTFHILARKTDLAAIRAIPADRIALVQIADAPRLDLDYLNWSRHYRNFPGQGDLPIQDFMLALQATGYDGPVSLEIFNDQFRAGSTRRVAVDGRRSLIYMLDQTRQAVGAQPNLPPPLPPRARPTGTAFIEFAIDDSEAPSFEGLLAGLGFTRAGEHISKDVTRWTQGAINIVTNRETEGFAHSFHIAHGAGVCAIGLEVDDAAATLARARSLLDVPFSQAVGPGELEVPAVRGVGGSLVYFVDRRSELGRIWDIEFRTPSPGAPARPAGLTRIDHISQSMHYEEMLTWLLFYNSLLDVTKPPEAEVLDPGGVVKSQILQTADGALRLVLNASQSGRTQSSRFLTEMFGSGVQHIAFATDDLLATAARLVANGVKLLRIPENYYEDLEARWDLPSDQLEAMRRLNVLYDRDGTGEYLQVYTRTFDERFFFEIVERRGGYTGFGAANAQIRLTAQALEARHPTLPRR